MGVEELLDFALEEDAGFSGFVEDDEVKELLDFTLDEEDFAEELLLDLTLDEEFTDELDLAELLLDFTEELLDSRSGSEMTEEDDTSAVSLPLTLLLDPSLSLRMTLDEEPGTEEEESPLMLEDDSSSSTAELREPFSPDALVELESSPQALKANSAKATALTKPIFLKVFIKNSEYIPHKFSFSKTSFP